MPSEARPQPLPSAAAQGSPGGTSSPHGGHTPLPTGSGLPHAPGPRLPVHTARRGGGQSPRGPHDPRRRTKGPGPRPPPATPIARRGAAHRAPPPPPPPPRAARNGGRATKWQPGGRRGADCESPAAPSPRSDLPRGSRGRGESNVPSHAVHARQEGTRGAPPALRYPRGSRVKPGGLARQGSGDGARGPLSRERVPPGRRSLTSPP